jgi:hypothetical protein
MLARVRTPSSWTNFSSLPALFTAQREKLREKEKEGGREKERRRK